jgi:hypothetical protein
VSRKCAKCGMESEVEEAFLPARNSSSNKTFYCPACWEKHSTQLGESYLIACAILLAGGLTWVLAQPQNELAWLVFQSGLFLCFTALLTLPHEVGHVLAAFATGAKVFQVNIGVGSIVYQCMFGGIEWRFNAIPIRGFVVDGIKSRKLYRIRQFLITLGGPMANLLLAIIGLVLLYCTSSMWTAALMKSFIAANVFGVIWTLVPRKVNVGGGSTPCDGLALLKLPFMSKSAIELGIESSYAWEGYSYNRNKKFEKAKRCYEEGMKQFPESFILQNGLAEVLLRSKRYADARALFMKLHTTFQNLACEHRNKLLNTIALTDIKIGTKELLDEADEFSKTACEKMPWNARFKWTRGLVLIEKGDIEQGLALLKEAKNKLESQYHESAYSRYIAEVENQKGNV